MRRNVAMSVPSGNQRASSRFCPQTAQDLATAYGAEKLGITRAHVRSPKMGAFGALSVAGSRLKKTTGRACTRQVAHTSQLRLPPGVPLPDGVTGAGDCGVDGTGEGGDPAAGATFLRRLKLFSRLTSCMCGTRAALAGSRANCVPMLYTCPAMRPTRWRRMRFAPATPFSIVRSSSSARRAARNSERRRKPPTTRNRRTRVDAGVPLSLWLMTGGNRPAQSQD